MSDGMVDMFKFNLLRLTKFSKLYAISKYFHHNIINGIFCLCPEN